MDGDETGNTNNREKWSLRELPSVIVLGVFIGFALASVCLGAALAYESMGVLKSGKAHKSISGIWNRGEINRLSADYHSVAYEHSLRYQQLRDTMKKPSLWERRLSIEDEMLKLDVSLYRLSLQITDLGGKVPNLEPGDILPGFEHNPYVDPEDPLGILPFLPAKPKK
jgi:hypothetical protein